jgi:hypothetical protein
MPQPFILSVEPTGKPSVQHGFHLGTDERVARQIAEGVFHKNVTYGPICTVALMRDRKIFDVYDGRWASETGFDVEFDDGDDDFDGRAA